MSALPSHERLRPGRQRLAREDVERSQRERLLVATLSVVAEHGYAAATVGDVVARAEVSRSTFYAQFTDKQACFLAAYDFALDLALRRLAEAETPNGSWRERVLADLTTYLNLLADEPALALTLHVEVLAAGPAALEHRVALLGELAGRIANVDALARASDSALRELPPAVFALYTGGLDELIRDRLRTGSPDALRELAEPVATAVFAMFGA